MSYLRLNSNHLEAFLALSREKSFTRAARSLGITQPALSQRIQALEAALELPLVLRSVKGLELSDAGKELLLFCQTQSDLESDLFSKLKPQGPDELKGHIRIGASSSHLRSVALPILRELAEKSSETHFSFTEQSVTSLVELLKRGSLDVILGDTEILEPGIKSEVVGEESFVMLELTTTNKRSEQFIGTDNTDPTLADFMKIQSKNLRKKPIERSYLGSVYSIIDAIELGYGSAVVPAHLVPQKKNLRIDTRYQTLKKEVFLSYHQQLHYSRLQSTVLKLLREKTADYL